MKIQISPDLRPVDADDVRADRDLGVDQIVVPFFAMDLDDVKRGADRVASLVS